MVKKIIKIVLSILSFFLLCLLQIYVFDSTYILGTRLNGILICCIIIAMTKPLKFSMPINGLIGFASDILFGNGNLQYFLIFMIVTIILECLKLVYKQDSSLSIAVYSGAGILAFQVLTSIFNTIRTGEIVNVFSFVSFVLKTMMVNIILAYIMYNLIIKVRDKMER